MKGEQSVTWRAREYEFTQKDASWYWLIGGGAATLILIALFQKNFFFAVFIAIAAGVVALLGKRVPEVVEYSVSEEGVRIGKEVLYPYNELHSFSVRKRESRLDEIVLRRKTIANPFIKLPANAHATERARALLKEKIEEEEYHESLLELFTEWLGF